MAVDVRELEAVEAASADSSPLAAAIDALASALPGVHQQRCAAALNELLRALSSGKGGEREAMLLANHLEADTFADRADSSGQSCRAEAIAALLRLGYPWAFAIRPADLDWYRARAKRGAWRRLVAAALVGLVLGGAASLLYQPAVDGPVVAPPASVQSSEEEQQPLAPPQVAPAVEEEKSPQLPPAPAETGSELSAEAITSVIAGRQPAFKTCLDQAARAEPTRYDEVRLVLMVGPSGAVTNASVAPRAWERTSWGQCLLKAGERAVFPSSDAETLVEVPLQLNAP